MKTIKEQLDEHFGAGCWDYVDVGGIIKKGDMVSYGVEDVLLEKAVDWVGESVAGVKRAYRAKPKTDKSITEQLDAKFGVDGWVKIPKGDAVGPGDLVTLGGFGPIFLVPVSGHGISDSPINDYYREKPKPEQSEKFWVVIVAGAVHSHETHLLAKEEAERLALEHGIDYYTFESVGIARAPKAVEYEKL